MFIYFHKNKLRYEKGQLAPFFILILVVLLLMAMVTVNLSKVAFIKTDSSNAADSGALAAGSVMANVFNAVASANSQMETFYWDFYAGMAIEFALAFTFLTLAITSATSALGFAGSAEGLACPSPCAAVGFAEAAAASAGKALKWLAAFIKTTWGITISVNAFYVAQYFFYLSIRDMAEEGREEAIKLGHNFVFINSGIGSKLKEGSPPAEIVEPAQKNNYRNEFSRFLDQEIGYERQYTYPWEDGQNRAHSVDSEITIDEVNIFDLKVAVLPLPVEVALLGASLALAYTAQESLTTAEASYAAAVPLLQTACECMACCLSIPPDPVCCACWMEKCMEAAIALTFGIEANAAALVDMVLIIPLMLTAWAGLFPGPIITDSDGVTAALFIICWIEDIQHNRLVRVDTTQSHQGADLGLWQTRYPDTYSYSQVNFEGQGDIHPPKLRHDASIIETDRIGS